MAVFYFGWWEPLFFLFTMSYKYIISYFAYNINSYFIYIICVFAYINFIKKASTYKMNA